MCYSAQVWAGYRKFVRVWGAVLSVEDFVRLYWERTTDAKLRIPKAMDADFESPGTAAEERIQALIRQHQVETATRLEQELFKQRKRLADAERSLRLRSTRAASESRRIASDKIAWLQGKLSDLRRRELQPRDSRIFPGWYAPVMVMEAGRRVVKPMRYQCRPAGKPASHDRRYPGTYNARRDNLEGFWKEQFGVSHGLVVANAFYENVSRHRVEQRELAPGEREQNVVLEFRPQPVQDMLIACLWSHWRGTDGEELLSFAAITDEPPAEVAAAGHDRCIIPIRPQHIDAWLMPDRADLRAQYAILDDRERPYFEHRLAA
jgi:putative SOS response-associated peptidase YedK